MQQLSKNKSYKIDVLRGCAILMVVIIHNIPIGLTQVWVRPFVNFSVGTFLFLSGMLSSAERWNPKKRILKIGIPYVIWTFVYVIIGNFRSPASIPVSFVKNLITAGSAAVMYYVFVYCELTLLIPLIDKLARSKYRWFGFLISPIEIIIMRLIPLLIGYEMNKYLRAIIHVSCLGWFIFFYLGYLLGNGLLSVKVSTLRVFLLLIISLVLQILEGYWYYSMGEENCGTILKITAVLSCVLFSFLIYWYLGTESAPAPKIFHFLGGYSFGIFFAHLAVMAILKHVPYYIEYVIFPLNAVVTIASTLLCVVIGRKLLGKYAKYLAL